MPSTAVSSPHALRPASLLRLVFEAYVALVVSALAGALLTLPVIFPQVRYLSETTLMLGARPADDTQLHAWAQAQPGVASVSLTRHNDEFTIRSEYRGSADPKPPRAALTETMHGLGYDIRGMQGYRTEMQGGFHAILTNAFTLAVMLAATQVAFGVVGLHRIRAANRRWPESPIPLFSGPLRKALATGAAGGLCLVAFGFLYAHLLRAWLGHAPSSPWDSSAAMSPHAKLVFLLFGGLGAPIAEEVFFRGCLLGKFKQAGRTGFGIAFSSILFGAVHFIDLYNLPGICLFGVCLAWMYHRTGSLAAPIAAHAVNNSIAILWLSMR